MSNNKILLNIAKNNYKELLSKTCVPTIVIIAISLSISYLFLGVGNQRDQFYWMSLFDSFATQPMTTLTLWIGNIWSKLFSPYIINLRVLKWMLEMSTFILAFMIIPNVQKRNCLILFSISLLLMGYGTHEYSPTVLTNFFLVALAFLLRKYQYSAQPLPIILLLAVISGLTISARFPNIVILFIIPFAILCQEFCDKQGFLKRVVHITIYLTASVVAYWTVMSLLTSSVFGFSYIASAFSSTAVGSHSIKALYQQYLWDFPVFFSYISSAFLFFLPIFVYRDNKISIWWKTAISFFSAVVFCLFFVKTIGFHKWNNINFTYFISAAVFACAGYGVYSSIRKKNWNNIVYTLVAVLLCFVPTIGSDTRYSKLFPIVLFFLPYLWTIAFSTHKNNFMFLPIPSILCLFALLCFTGNPICAFSPTPLWECSHITRAKVLSGIKVSDDDIKVIDTILKDSQFYRGEKKVYGNIAPFVSIISQGEINNGNKVYDFDFNSIINSQRFIDENKKTTLFICNDCSEPMKGAVSFLIDNSFSVMEENSLYYILQYSPSDNR